MAVVKNFLDLELGKFVSRTLMVFIIFTVFFSLKMISEENYLTVSLLYVGGLKVRGIIGDVLKARLTMKSISPVKEDEDEVGI